ncbi:MAG: sel1 repeat family protein [Geobacter sp.]|nr:MAG: sel1 repeat family protein [Geobacter sp.]
MKLAIVVLVALVLSALPALGFDGVDIAAVKKQAEAGNAEAQSKLGVLYSSGVGISQDKKEAVRWYTKSAEQGNALGQYNLALMYLKGEGGLAEDPVKGRDLLRKAADQWLAAAQYDLGIAYLYGVGGEQSRDEAEKWLRRASTQGDRSAKKKLEELSSHPK